MTSSSTLSTATAISRPASLEAPEILERHGRWLRSILFARLGHAQAVEDVMQEVALAIVKSQSLPVEDARLGPWLYRVAVRQALLHRRKLGRQKKLSTNFVEAVPPSDHDTHTPEPITWLLANERRKLIRVAMQRLAPRDAEMLMLKYTEDWNYHEIAERLGISHAAVESRLHRARARLRQELANLQVIDEAA